jgi:hypothetical protein
MIMVKWIKWQNIEFLTEISYTDSRLNPMSLIDNAGYKVLNKKTENFNQAG